MREPIAPRRIARRPRHSTRSRRPSTRRAARPHGPPGPERTRRGGLASHSAIAVGRPGPGDRRGPPDVPAPAGQVEPSPGPRRPAGPSLPRTGLGEPVEVVLVEVDLGPLGMAGVEGVRRPGVAEPEPFARREERSSRKGQDADQPGSNRGSPRLAAGPSPARTGAHPRRSSPRSRPGRSCCGRDPRPEDHRAGPSAARPTRPAPTRRVRAKPSPTATATSPGRHRQDRGGPRSARPRRRREPERRQAGRQERRAQLADERGSRASTGPNRGRARSRRTGPAEGRPRGGKATRPGPIDRELIGPGLEPVLIARGSRAPGATRPTASDRPPGPADRRRPSVATIAAEDDPGDPGREPAASAATNGTLGKSAPSSQSGQDRPTMSRVAPQRTARNRARPPVGPVRTGPRRPRPSELGDHRIGPAPFPLQPPWVTSSSQIPGGWPVGGVIPRIADRLLPGLRPDSSSSRASLSRFLNAL